MVVRVSLGRVARQLTDILVLDVAPGLGVDLCLCV